MMDMMRPATRIQQFTLDILENFQTKTPEKFYKTEDDKRFVEQRFDDYFIYSYISTCHKKRPLEVFLSNKLFEYPPEDQKILSEFTGHIFSGFSIGNVSPGFYFWLKICLRNVFCSTIEPKFKSYLNSCI